MEGSEPITTTNVVGSGRITAVLDYLAVDQFQLRESVCLCDRYRTSDGNHWSLSFAKRRRVCFFRIIAFCLRANTNNGLALGPSRGTQGGNSLIEWSDVADIRP